MPPAIYCRVIALSFIYADYYKPAFWKRHQTIYSTVQYDIYLYHIYLPFYPPLLLPCSLHTHTYMKKLQLPYTEDPPFVEDDAPTAANLRNLACSPAFFLPI